MWLAWKILNTLLWCWRERHTTQNYIFISVWNNELWHICKSLLPSAKGQSIYFHVTYFHVESTSYSNLNLLVGKHHVVGKDPNIYIHSNIFDHDSLLLTIIFMISMLGGETLSPYLSMCSMDIVCSKNMPWLLAIIKDYMIIEYVKLLLRLDDVLKLFGDQEHRLLSFNRMHCLNHDMWIDCYSIMMIFMRKSWWLWCQKSEWN